MPKIFTFETRDPTTIRNGMLRVLANGIPGANVTPGSEWFVFTQGIANELAVVEANALIKSDAQMPDSAEDEDLYRICETYGLFLQPGAGSTGPVVLNSKADTTIATGAQLIDAVGLRYELVSGGTFSNGTALTVRALDTGKATNHPIGDVLRWVSAPSFSDEKALVGTGGLVNGHDPEDDEGLRARLYARLQNPPRSGNWEHVAELAEESSAAVVKGFPYPALQGPGSLHVAVVAAPTATSKLRDVASTTLNTAVVPYVQGQMPEHVFIVTTTVTNVPTFAAFALSIPEAPTASPAGPGGGWLDGSPWPDIGVAGGGTTVTAVTSTTQFTVNASAAPIVGVSRVSFLSPVDWIVRTARVVAVAGSTGAWVITIDAPFTDIAVSSYIWPACVNQQAYADRVLASFAAMGPGEKTTNPSSLTHGFRRPRPETAWPYALGAQMLRDLVHSQPEMAFASFVYRSDGTSTIVGASGQLLPQVPAVISSPPNIFVPSKIGFYRAT